MSEKKDKEDKEEEDYCCPMCNIEKHHPDLLESIEKYIDRKCKKDFDLSMDVRLVLSTIWLENFESARKDIDNENAMYG